MTIHHDKMAYGKLASLREDLTQEQLDKISEQLAGESEYDRMVRGEVYNPAEEQLVAMRKRARRLFYRYNNSEEDEQELRQALLHQLFGSHGENLYCEPPLRFDYGCNFHVGENFYSNFNLTVLDVAPVRVGKNCMFGRPCIPFLPATGTCARAGTGSNSITSIPSPSPSEITCGWQATWWCAAA